MSEDNDKTSTDERTITIKLPTKGVINLKKAALDMPCHLSEIVAEALEMWWAAKRPDGYAPILFPSLAKPKPATEPTEATDNEIGL